MILIKTIFIMRFIVLFCLSGILFFSCSSEPHHHRKPYTGDYDVVVNLSEEILNFDHIKDTIREHINQAKSEINDLKLEDKINVEHSLTIEEDGQNIINEDSLKATIKDLGSNIGELAKSITEFAGNISMKSLDLLSGLKNNLNFKVTLNEDGTFSSTDSKLGKFILDIETWDIRDHQFIVLDDQKKSKYTFTIESKSDTGFILKNEDMRLEFKKRQ
jgi:hypothetical protein